MIIEFTKYSATGNDFILIDNRELIFKQNISNLIRKICERRVSIGADGVILLENAEFFDFRMRYYNKDGFEAEMCGNGSRAISKFASKLMKKDNFHFKTMNNSYHSEILDEKLVKVEMSELKDFEKINLSKFKYKESLFLDTGVPHSVFIVKNLDKINVAKIGAEIRYDKIFPNGTNANFIEILDNNEVKIRTYERGVEDETLSCGTGITASAIMLKEKLNFGNEITFKSNGGILIVEFSNNKVYLKGEVNEVYFGSFNI